MSVELENHQRYEDKWCANASECKWYLKYSIAYAHSYTHKYFRAYLLHNWKKEHFREKNQMPCGIHR